VPPRSYLFRIADILDAIERIRRYTTKIPFDDFQKDSMRVDAVIRAFTVIGEAARMIPLEVQSAYPSVPWREAQDMRNLLVHEYFGIDLTQIWTTIELDLPVLEAALRPILATNVDGRHPEAGQERPSSD